jgi:hypothetical protein
MEFMHIKQHKSGFGKRGTWVFSDLLYWMFYIPMTAAIIFFLVIVPFSILQTRLETHNLEHAIIAERAFNKISYRDDETGRIYPGVASREQLNKLDIGNFFSISLDARRTAIKLTAAGKGIYFNEAFYEIAKPLAPVRYYELITKKQLNIIGEQQIAQLETDVVSSQKWGQ